MKLPGSEKAYVPLHKLAGYLLSETHPTGVSKARFFRGLGFSHDAVDPLEEGLLGIARKGYVEETKSSPYGIKYVIDGPLSTPGGNVVMVRTIWIIELGDDRPRFVTAYPL